MAEAILVIAKSGSGKTTSLMNLNPKEVMVIQPRKKRLPFKDASSWTKWNKDKGEGSIFQTNTFSGVSSVLKKMEEVKKKIVIIDDFVYLFSQKVMDDIEIKGYDKWNEIGLEFNNMMNLIESMDEDMRVYILTHSDINDMGQVKMKTAGKLIDNLLTPEGYFNIVFGMTKNDNGSFFITNGSTMDPYKSPMGMFKEKQVPNDLKKVDDTICDFYGIQNKTSK